MKCPPLAEKVGLYHFSLSYFFSLAQCFLFLFEQILIYHFSNDKYYVADVFFESYNVFEESLSHIEYNDINQVTTPMFHL